MGLLIVLTIVSVIVNMIIGSVWYMPKVFGNMWMKDAKLDAKKMNKQTMMTAMIVSAVCYAIIAVFMGYTKEMFFQGSIQQFLISIIAVWLIFVLCLRLVHTFFEQKSLRYVAITSGHDLVTLLATGIVMYYV